MKRLSTPFSTIISRLCCVCTLPHLALILDHLVKNKNLTICLAQRLDKRLHKKDKSWVRSPVREKTQLKSENCESAWHLQCQRGFKNNLPQENKEIWGIAPSQSGSRPSQRRRGRVKSSSPPPSMTLTFCLTFLTHSSNYPALLLTLTIIYILLT